MDLKDLIKNTEERYISYKKILEDLYKNKIVIPDWFKDLLHEMKNTEKELMEKLIEERINENQGLNPPYCYNLNKK